jgi:hypothetical protein
VTFVRRSIARIYSAENAKGTGQEHQIQSPITYHKSQIPQRFSRLRSVAVDEVAGSHALLPLELQFQYFDRGVLATT